MQLSTSLPLLFAASDGLLQLEDGPQRLFLPAGTYLPAARLLHELTEALGQPVGQRGLRMLLASQPALPGGIAIGSRKLWRPGDVEPLAEGLERLLLEARRAGA